MACTALDVPAACYRMDQVCTVLAAPAACYRMGQACTALGAQVVCYCMGRACMGLVAAAGKAWGAWCNKVAVGKDRVLAGAHYTSL